MTARGYLGASKQSAIPEDAQRGLLAIHHRLVEDAAWLRTALAALDKEATP